jgi:hypothetical protein
MQQSCFFLSLLISSSSLEIFLGKNTKSVSVVSLNSLICNKLSVVLKCFESFLWCAKITNYSLLTNSVKIHDGFF